MQPSDYLTTIRYIIKLYDNMLKPICEKYQLTLIEANIISFLYHNPGKDTAKEIVEIRMLSKGNVSQAVEALIQKSLLKRYQDTRDRRKIHLLLQPETKVITQAMEIVHQKFLQTLFQEISPEEQILLFQLNQTMKKNAETALQRGNLS